ncbi:MAG: Gfo/Idh/MocA family oxidoreductase, partial [Candidatus Poribacteria bacterium]|nr:Gfo/Idh/MocA family oxidoreductase [Candidatus Poribacteria bacterium]
MANELKAAIVGCGRMGGFIDDEMVGRPGFVPPYCHAGAHVESRYTTLVAASDVLTEKASALAAKWDVPKTYADYREMIATEQPEILSICTRPNNHAEIIGFAAENGVKGIYCEKPLCCSMEEADAIRDAVGTHNVAFNLGVNRRFQEGFWRLRELIDGGEIGNVQSVVSYSGGGALWTHTHTTDMLLYLAGDSPVKHAQGHAGVAADDFADNRTDNDPPIHNAYFAFENGARGTMNPCTGYEFEVHGSKGKLRTLGNGMEFEWRVYDGHGGSVVKEFPDWTRSSGAVNCVDDLCRAVLNGGETRAGIAVSHLGQE